jgi:hypothetical protein
MEQHDTVVFSDRTAEICRSSGASAVILQGDTIALMFLRVVLTAHGLSRVLGGDGLQKLLGDAVINPAKNRDHQKMLVVCGGWSPNLVLTPEITDLVIIISGARGLPHVYLSWALQELKGLKETLKNG